MYPAFFGNRSISTYFFLRFKWTRVFSRFLGLRTLLCSVVFLRSDVSHHFF